MVSSSSSSIITSNNNKGGTTVVMTRAKQLQTGLVETNQKVEASLLETIQEHIQKHHHHHPSTNQKRGVEGLDFLHVKNSLLLSYLIDLVVYLKGKLSSTSSSATSSTTTTKAALRRLNEMKVVLDKTRGLDKKLRYQIDKLLQAENAATFASSEIVVPQEEEEAAAVIRNTDPLQYRPDPKAFDNDDDDDDEDSSNASGEPANRENNDEGDDDDDDDDLEAAKRTIALAKESKRPSNKKYNDTTNNNNSISSNNYEDNVYRAPRHTAMPYMLDKEDKEAQRQKREVRRMRTSELAQSLRSQYGEQPDQEDYHGGTEYGQQAQAAKRFAEREAEKIKMEENSMIRLTVTRKEKKERKRLMRLEGSNLNGIADLGNLVRDASRVIDTHDDDDNHNNNDNDNDRRGRGRGGDMPEPSKRHANGKRRKEMIDHDGRPMKTGGRKGGNKGAKNSYQAALYDGGGGSSKKRKSKR